MKRTITVIACLIIVGAALAQKNFEGEITYKLHATAEDKPDAELKILFGPKAMKLRFKEKEDYDKNELLVLFDSAAQYTLNTENKTYKKRILTLRSEPSFIKNKNIAGYSTTGIINERNSISQLASEFMTMGNSIFYLADTLYYTIHSYFGPDPVLSAIQNNKIVLGAEIMMQTGTYEMTDASKNKNIITAEAIEVKPMHFADNMFSLPADYTSNINSTYEEPVADSAMAVMDTVAAPKPIKKSVKKPAKPVEKKTNNQPAAIRRKQ